MHLRISFSWLKHLVLIGVNFCDVLEKILTFKTEFTYFEIGIKTTTYNLYQKYHGKQVLLVWKVEKSSKSDKLR